MLIADLAVFADDGVDPWFGGYAGGFASPPGAGTISEADARFLPVPVEPPPGPASPQRRRVSLRVVAAAALIGLVLGRLSKRDDL